MRFPSISGSKALITTLLLTFASLASSERMLQSDSLDSCSVNPGFTATLFDVVFTPDNGTLSYNINAVSSISGNVTAQIQLIAYGIVAFNTSVDPCSSPDLAALCPLNPGVIPNINSNSQFPPSALAQVPWLAYTWPDLDAQFKVFIKNRTTGEVIACVQANLSNGKTVNQGAVQWVLAVIAGLALLISAVTSGLGHSNSAAHIAANALSLFGYFQAQAMIGMTAVTMPPMVAAWAQNFQWSMGMVSIGFMQNVCTWYQMATGGTPSTILSTLATTSVHVQKRSMEFTSKLLRRGLGVELYKRESSTVAPIIVAGIERVGFHAGIEPTNIFLTGLGFFVAFVVFVAIGVALFKGFCEVAANAGWFKKGDKFQEFRNGWKIVLKGILFRLVLIGYAQMCVLCLWELTVRDSAAEVVLALFYFIAMTIALVWAAMKVVWIARRSVAMHRNPAYILYSDPTSLNKWGFLYVQFRATAYYFIFPILLYILLKAIFVAFAQGAPVAQTIGLLVIEAAFLIGVCILKPWMDKKTNGFNISIAVINFLNVIFLLIFTKIFNQPGLVTGVVGVAYFLINGVFATILLLYVLITAVMAIISKDPDTRYQPMRDDRGSFIKSQTNLNTELDALGVTARGDMRMKVRDLDDDSDSLSSASMAKRDAAGIPLPPSTAASNRNMNGYEPPRSPIDPSAPFIPSEGAPRHGTPVGGYADGNRNMYSGQGYSDYSRSNNNSPAPRYNGQQSYVVSSSITSNTSHRPQNNSTPWQRGAGYEH